MKPSHERHAEEAAKARRDIERINEQAAKLTEAGPDAGDIDPNDPIEIWGKRIGRTIGYIIVIYLIYHLVTTYALPPQT